MRYVLKVFSNQEKENDNLPPPKELGAELLEEIRERSS